MSGLQLRRSDSNIPRDALKPPGSNFYLAVCEDLGNNAFGMAMHHEGNLVAWFPYGGDEVVKEGDDFSFAVRDTQLSYSWVRVSKYLKRPNEYNPIVVDDISPAAFVDRIGKVNLQTLEGWTCFGGSEYARNEEEVKEAKVLCYRRVNECPVIYHQTVVGAYPPSNAVRAPHCTFKSFVALSQDYDPPTFGRACLNKHRDGLQAWFPYGGGEEDKDNFVLLRYRKGHKLYWAPIREVVQNPHRHEIVKYGDQSPAVMKDILGKAIIHDVQGWIGYDGDEIGVDREDVLNGTVLCFKEDDD